jgi:hypothetical protein
VQVEKPLVQMLDRQRVHQAVADAAKKLVDASALAARKLADAFSDFCLCVHATRKARRTRVRE